MPRWYEDDDSYLSQRFPNFFGGADVYSEVSPYDDLNDYGFRRSKIGPVKRGPKDARIGPATPQKPQAIPEPWYERLGTAMGRGYGDINQQPVRTPPFVPERSTIGPSRQPPLGNRLPAGDYRDTNTPQRLIAPTSTGGMLTPRQPEYSGNPIINAMVAARANSTGANAPNRPPSIYGEGASAIPNAIRIAMENARTNSNAPGRPPVRQAGGVNIPGSASLREAENYPIDTRFGPRDYPAATRVAAANRRPMGVPSGVPMGPPPGGITAPMDSPIQVQAPQTNGSPYEPPIGRTGWTERAPAPFMGPNAQSGPGAWNKFDITQEGGRNAGAEGNFPGTVAEEQGPGFDPNSGPNGAQYNWTPSERYNKYLESEPSRQDYKPGKWSRLLNAASAGLHGYQTKDIGEAVALGTALNDRPYNNAVEEWKRRGTGLARAVDLEDKRYKIATEHENRLADNARQERELDLRKQALLLQDREFMQKVGMDNFKMMTEGWQKSIGPNDKMILFRMGPNGYEQKETDIPNSELTAAEKRAENLAVREASMARARLAASTSTANTTAQINARATEAEKDRKHQATEGMLGRAVRLETAGMNRGATGGEDYATPARLLGSPDFRDLSQTGLVKIINAPDNQGKPRIVFSYEDENELQAALEKAAGGDGAKLRRLSDQYKAYQDYVQQWGGGQ